MRQAANEAIHREAIMQASLLLFLVGRRQELPICVQEGSKAPGETGSNLLGVEGGWANDADLLRTSCVSEDPTTATSVDAIFCLIITNAAYRSLVLAAPLQAMSFCPAGSVAVSNRLHEYIWHDSRRSQSRLRVYRWCVIGSGVA